MESTKQTPIEDQRKDALAHYEELSSKACHFSSFVKDAILAYDPYSRERVEALEKEKMDARNTFSGRLKKRDAEIKSLESKLSTLEEVLAEKNAWPLVDVLKRLTFAADYLLKIKNYDGQGYEEVATCANRAKEIINAIEKLKLKTP